ncbi:MAG TPA: phosphate signaling complex protein PhoU [Dongiaceae bacterium]|jgi:phosphate transport system protein|nr:phosphate signaling complex protein PhoU [Dongiaceae bacterium]
MPINVRREFDAELQDLKKKVLVMGSLVQTMLADSLTALFTRDTPLATSVDARDNEVDRMEIAVDELAVRIIALRQPAASDLRLIIAALKIIKDIERIGDIAVNIAERVIELNAEPQLKPYIDLPRMVDAVQAMIRDALDAFVNDDPELAQKVLDGDDLVDNLNVQMFNELLAIMLGDTKTINRATRLIFISKYLERAADHATNVAEEVIFAIQGRDVRHGNVG